MNKYLEKIAGIIPRNVKRVFQQGLKETMRDAEGVGARNMRSYDAVLAKKNATIKGAFANTQAKVNPGPAATANAAKANAEFRTANTRAIRAARARDLGQRGAKNAIQAGKTAGKVAGGVAALGTAGVTGAALTKKDE